MSDFNHVVLTGRLTRDPEIQTLASGTVVATFILANEPFWTNDESKRRTNFIVCKAFGKLADFVEKNLFKGQHIGVGGELSITSKKNEDGSYVNYTQVMVGDIKLFPGSFRKDNGVEEEDTSFYGPEETPVQRQPVSASRGVPSGRRVPGRR